MEGLSGGIKFREVLVYGIGKNNQIIADMEDGYIQAVGVINSYSVGYLSVQQAIQGRGQEKEVMASIINKDEIYTRKTRECCLLWCNRQEW